MEAGQCEAVTKFGNSCTEGTGQQNSVLYFRQKPTYNNYRGNSRRLRGRNNYPRNSNNNNNFNGNTNDYNNRNRQRYDNNRNNRRNVRATSSNTNS